MDSALHDEPVTTNQRTDPASPTHHDQPTSDPASPTVA